jgi:hypothetical protein
MNYTGFTVTREIREVQIDVKEPVEEEKNNKTTNYNFEQTAEEKEISRIMELFEQTRIKNPELFNALMLYNKEMLEIVSKETSTHEEIKHLEDLFRKTEIINDDFTFWIVLRGIKTSILETKNLDIVHFFLVKKGFELPPQFYENIVHQFLRSLSEVDFILDENNEPVSKYSTILQIMIEYGKVDLNERERNTMYSPLHLSVIFKQLQFVMILLHNGCDIGVKNKSDETALDIANDYISDDGEDKLIYEKIRDLIKE